MATLFQWAGAVTPTGFTLAGKVTSATTSVRLAVSTNSNMAGATFFGPQAPTTDSGVLHPGKIIKLAATGLTPNTRYYYAFECNGTISRVGTLKTWPNAGVPHTFKFAAVSCYGGENGNTAYHWPNGLLLRDWVTWMSHARPYASNELAWDHMRAHNPDLFISTGDHGYWDVPLNDERWFHDMHDALLDPPRVKEFFDGCPVDWIWDDHDFGPNDSDSTNPSRPASVATYRSRAPHYPLPSTQGGIYHTFVVGRVRFVVTDNRSLRSPKGATDNASKVVLGAEQEAWFTNLLSTATEPVICWVNSFPWIGPTTGGADWWGGYNTERTRLANFFASVPGLTNRMFIVSGDMHANALDDGRNNQWGGFPVCHFAALDAPGSSKGGPYWKGPSSGRARYGTVDIEDTGGNTITITARGYTNATLWDTMTWTVSAAPTGTVALKPASDVSNTGWTPDTGSEVFSRLRQGTGYAASPLSGGGVAVMTLDPIAEPVVSNGSNVVLEVVADKWDGSIVRADGDAVTLRCELLNASNSVLATVNTTLAGAAQTITFAIPSGVTVPTNPRLRISRV
jgi:hypothetical protein